MKDFKKFVNDIENHTKITQSYMSDANKMMREYLDYFGLNRYKVIRSIDLDNSYSNVEYIMIDDENVLDIFDTDGNTVYDYNLDTLKRIIEDMESTKGNNVKSFLACVYVDDIKASEKFLKKLDESDIDKYFINDCKKNEDLLTNFYFQEFLFKNSEVDAVDIYEEQRNILHKGIEIEYGYIFDDINDSRELGIL